MFLLGIWKDFNDLESSLSIDELMAVLASSRKKRHDEQIFLASLQGVDLTEETKEATSFEDLKARVFSGGKAADANDIMSLQGITANQLGFGINNGIDFEEAGADFEW